MLRKLVGVILVTAAAVYAACGERAYLPSVGVPSLRIQAATTNHLGFDLKSFLMPVKPAVPSNAVAQAAAPAAATNIPVVFNPVSASPGNTNQAPFMPPAVTDAKNNSEPPDITPISPPSASDLLTVTPQMITEYLKPGQNQTQTNQTGAVIFVPAQLQFAPPAPNASGESRATYKTQ